MTEKHFSTVRQNIILYNSRMGSVLSIYCRLMCLVQKKNSRNICEICNDFLSGNRLII